MVYSNKMEVSFQENDIVPITLNFEEFLTKEEIEYINRKAEIDIGHKNIDFGMMNGISSDFLMLISS